MRTFCLVLKILGGVVLGAVIAGLLGIGFLLLVAATDTGELKDYQIESQERRAADWAHDTGRSPDEWMGQCPPSYQDPPR